MTQIAGKGISGNNLFDSYIPPAGCYDEVRDANGNIRQHWQQPVQMFQDLSIKQLLSRCRQVDRYVSDLGLSHRIYNQANLIERTAVPDCIPLIISPSEWSEINLALQQRAQMLELMIRDLYGPARLIHEKIIPPEIIYGNPTYLRSCVGYEPIGKKYLHIYAADLMRAADGTWSVMTDRTQSPSGAGFALEHRRALLRVFPEFLRNCKVHGILPYIARFRNGLNGFAQGNQDPRVVLLTPGPYHEAYYEHALLCKLFGYTLAEGGDLTVRGSRVYLKVLEGLLPVDLILRRVDDLFCDPLELQSDSILAPPGMVEAARNQGVAIVNALGTGIGHTPALLPFFPSICRFLLGEDLISRSVPTWWCGQRDAYQYVMSNLDQMVIKPAMPARMFDPVFCGKLSGEKLAAIRNHIAAAPGDFVAQEHVPGSTIPVLDNMALSPARVQLRCFLSAEKESYTLLPGGSARYQLYGESDIISVQTGAGSKDVWIITPNESDISDEGTTSRGGQIVYRSAGSIPSRVADNFYWVGRHIDRIESSVRLARMILLRISDQQTEALSPELNRLISTLICGPTQLGVSARMLIKSHLFDPGSVNGLRHNVRELLRLARSSRDQLGNDLLRILRQIDEETDMGYYGNTQLDPSSLISILNSMVMHLASFHGLVIESMTHTPSWKFLEMGRRIERSTEMVRLLQSTLVDTSLDESSILSAVLETTDCPLTYRQLYFAAPRTSSVAELLISDSDNPRSVIYGIRRIAEHLQQLPRINFDVLAPLRRTVQKLISTCELFEMSELCEPVENKRRQSLAHALSDISEKLRYINELITQNFFSHSVVRRQSDLTTQADKP